jgi:hypothetical protein
MSQAFNPLRGELASVSVTTIQGDVYQFPNVPFEDIKQAIQAASEDVTQLTLVNVSHASLVVPWRIVQVVFAAVTKPDSSWCKWERGEGFEEHLC